MPIYTNGNVVSTRLEGNDLAPGTSIQLEEFLVTLPSGVTQTAVIGFLDPILLSQKVAATETIAVPATLTGRYDVEIFCTAGEVSVQYNDAAATARVLGPGMAERVYCAKRLVNSIIITIASGTSYVTIRKA